MTILTSSQYEQFSFIQGNRKLYSTLVNNLKKSLQKKNLLEFHPILVTADFQIVDGQHRFEACRQLGIPVKYVITKFSGLDVIQSIQTQSSWKLGDYLQSYITQGNDHYIRLQAFQQEHHCSFNAAVYLLSGGQRHSADKFRSGNFQIVDEALAKKAIKLVDICAPYFVLNHLKNSRAFLSAIVDIVHAGVCVPDRLFEKMLIAEKKIPPYQNKKGYLHDIEDIYNYAAKGASKVRIY